MKSLFYLSLMAAGMLAVHANGQSLYTLAGPVGLEESLPLKWTFNLAGGYDDNVNASNYDQQEAAFISTDIGALPGQLRFRDPVLLLRQAWGYLLPEGP